MFLWNAFAVKAMVPLLEDVVSRLRPIDARPSVTKYQEIECGDEQSQPQSMSIWEWCQSLRS